MSKFEQLKLSLNQEETVMRSSVITKTNTNVNAMTSSTLTPRVSPNKKGFNTHRLEKKNEHRLTTLIPYKTKQQGLLITSDMIKSDDGGAAQ